MTKKYFDAAESAAIAAVRKALADCIDEQKRSKLDIRHTLKRKLEIADKQFSDFQQLGWYDAPNDPGGTVDAITPHK